MGQLAGNHFLTIGKGQDDLCTRHEGLWEGAQDILFERLEGTLPA